MVTPVPDSAPVKALQQQLAALDRRLEPLENLQQQTRVLSQRLRQLEQGQQNLAQAYPALAQTTPRRAEARQNATALPSDTATADLQKNPPGEARRIDDMEHFESTFWQEPEHPTWSREVETAMQDTLDKLDIPDTVLDWVHCQQSACRIELLHPEGTGDTTFIETVHASEAFSGEFYAESMPGRNGQRHTLIYLARPGQPLFSLHTP